MILGCAPADVLRAFDEVFVALLFSLGSGCGDDGDDAGKSADAVADASGAHWVGSFAVHMCGQDAPSKTIDITGPFDLP